MPTRVGWVWPSCVLLGLGLAGACRDGDGAAGGGGGDPGAAGEPGRAGAGDGAAGGGAHAGGGGGQSGGGGGAGPTGGQGGGVNQPMLTDCEGDSIALDPELTRHCVVLTSCLGGTSDGSRRLALLDCISSPGGVAAYHFSYQGGKSTEDGPWEPAGLRGCGREITGCDDVLACAGERVPGAECDEDDSPRCDGELAVNCGGRVRDCEQLTGEKGACQVLGSGESAHAECVVEATCDGDLGDETCVGDERVVCGEGGVGYGEDCAARGLTCVAAGGAARCVEVEEPNDPNCADVGEVACDGDARTYCSPDGDQFRAPSCAEAGDLVCAENDGVNVGERWADCVPAGCAEPKEELTVACAGDDLVTSDEYGSTLRIHCPDYGFETCRQGLCSD